MNVPQPAAPLRWLYALALLPVLTDLLERGRLPDTPRGWITEVVLGAVILALVRRLRRQFMTIAAQSLADPLTGLGNRRAFDAALAAECRRAGRLQQPLTLVFMDLDRFKQVNDQHGHDVGDGVLRQFADAIRSSVRAGVDSGWRVGGDEFVLLLPASTGEQAAHVIGRIRAHCEAGSSLWLDGPLGLSTGVVALAPGEGPQAFLQRADAAMYEHKASRRSGRPR